MIIDYTTWRKGKVVSSWTYVEKGTGIRKPAKTVIAVCPKCGKKGEKCGSPTRQN